MLDTPHNDFDPQEQRKLAAFDVARARDVEAMTKTAGWKHLCDLINKTINDRTSTLLQPVEEGKVMASEHNKGVVCGLMTARDLPTLILKAAKDSRATTEDSAP